MNEVTLEDISRTPSSLKMAEVLPGNESDPDEDDAYRGFIRTVYENNGEGAHLMESVCCLLFWRSRALSDFRAITDAFEENLDTLSFAIAAALLLPCITNAQSSFLKSVLPDKSAMALQHAAERWKWKETQLHKQRLRQCSCAHKVLLLRRIYASALEEIARDDTRRVLLQASNGCTDWLLAESPFVADGTRRLFRLPFEKALTLLSSRRGLLSEGWIYFTADEFDLLLSNWTPIKYWSCLKLSSCEDRVWWFSAQWGDDKKNVFRKPLMDFLRDFLPVSPVSHVHVSVCMEDVLTKHAPPCIQQLSRLGCTAKYDGRYLLGRTLASLNMFTLHEIETFAIHQAKSAGRPLRDALIYAKELRLASFSNKNKFDDSKKEPGCRFAVQKGLCPIAQRQGSAKCYLGAVQDCGSLLKANIVSNWSPNLFIRRSVQIQYEHDEKSHSGSQL
jgi:hypothetical protein